MYLFMQTFCTKKAEKQEKIQTNYNTRFGKRDVQFGFFPRHSPFSVFFYLLFFFSIFVFVLNLNFICRAKLNIQLAFDLLYIYYIFDWAFRYTMERVLVCV